MNEHENGVVDDEHAFVHAEPAPRLYWYSTDVHAAAAVSAGVEASVTEPAR